MNNRQIDMLVIDNVMGIGERCVVSFFSPSTTISHAWQVIDQFPEMVEVLKVRSDNYVCYVHEGECDQYVATASTAPMAICIALLKAKGIEVNVEGGIIK